VETEQAIERRLSRFPVPEFVWQEYALDQTVNDRGIQVDLQLVQQAIRMDALTKDKLLQQMKALTHLDNPNSVYQLLGWLETQGYQSDSLGKAQVQELIKTAREPVRSVLELRLQLSKASVKKYQAMQNAVCSDGRARGMFQFYGANRTGREAGRIIQLQNLPQNHLPDLEAARELVKSGNLEAVELLYEDVPDTLSQLIRTAFVPKPGYQFLVADFSAIEARVIAWLAGETWRMQAFAEGKDIYCASASKIFGVPVVKHGINGHLRQKGKVAELACGYGGSVGAMKQMGGAEMSDAELKQLVTDWRNASPHIVQLWWDVERAALTAVREQLPTETHGFQFSYESGFLFIRLLSGRRLAYVKPRIEPNRFGGDSITYEGIGTGRKWERLETYSGKLVENLVQATARDLLFYSMQTLSQYFIVGHIHDEIILECPKDTKLEEICQQMARTPDWAKGLLLRADGYACQFYKKD
jgi:DNA polymerase